MNKYRVWWIPQLGIKQTFYVPVDSPEEGKKVMDVLAYYDLFQLQNKVKPDYMNTGGLEVYEDGEWVDWYYDDEQGYFDSIHEYCGSDCCKCKKELEEFESYLQKQIDMDVINRM